MSVKSFSNSKLGLLAGLMILGLLISSGVLAKQSTALIILDDDTEIEATFAGAACANKAMGTTGCLKMKKGKKNEHFKFDFVDLTAAGNWKWIEMQIREPFKDWEQTDSVREAIRDDLKISGTGGGNFFGTNGKADLSAAGTKFQIKDRNDEVFIIQYRIEITNKVDGTSMDPRIWVHPSIANEGPE